MTRDRFLLVAVLVPLLGGLAFTLGLYPLHSVRADAVANDDFDNAITVNAVPYTNTQDVGSATTAADDPAFTCGWDQGYNTVWYRYTPDETGILIVNTFGSTYDTVLAVWTGARGSLTSRACNDDSGGTQSEVAVFVNAGTTYYIEVASYSAITSGSLTLSVSFIPPTLLYAAPTAQGSGDCSSWANACALQTALAQAASGDEIWVKAGVHYPGAAGERTATFTLKNGVALYGGFAGTETQRDQRDWQANKTILSGDIDRNDINTDGNFIAETWNDIQGNNAYHVVTAEDAVNAAVLDGFIITAGQANGDSPDSYGGGMYDSGNPTLMNVTFSGNYASDFGGGMMSDGMNGNAAPLLTNVTFSGNSAGYSGGGMENFCGSPTLINVTFSGNSATNGGGMYNSGIYGGGDATLTNVTFSGNSAAQGGGMYNNLSVPKITNAVFHNNFASDGGGIYNRGSTSELTNVTFSGNQATNLGGGVYNGAHPYYGEDSETTLANAILWGDIGAEIYNASTSVITVTHSLVEGGWPGEGNINADPLFVDAPGGNLRLKDGSLAIDTGNNVAVPPGVATDLDGNPRFDYIVDMGAYEYQNGPGLRPFGKASPLNGNTSQPLTLTLSWRASHLVDTYAYCYDTNDNNACDTTWITTTGTSVQISGLSQGVTYYWQVRAANNESAREADGGIWWSFTTAPSSPGLFSKISPLNGTGRAPVVATLSWGASPGVEQYEYCYDTTNDNACSTWLSAGTDTSVVLLDLLPDTTYYWQVRATNAYGTTYADGSSTNFWLFTTYHLPGAFTKTSPANGSDRVNTVTLSWGASSDVDAYEYCYDTTDDNACATWRSAGTSTSVTLSDLNPSAIYYWQVRARNAGGVTYADGSSAAFWSFRVNLVRWDGNTNKLPVDNALEPPGNQVWFWTNLARTQWRNFRLNYTHVGYCQTVRNVNTIQFQFDGPGSISNNQFSSSSATFAFTGQLNSPTTASGTFIITNYRLVLQGTSGTCTVYVNDSGTWTTTRPLLRPGVFSKAEPANGATNQNTTLALWWDPSTDAAEYQYCVDTHDNDACDTNWVSAGANLGVDLSGLAEDTTYYWQVRASNAISTTYANDGVWWWFRTRDTTAPTIVSSVRLDANPTSAASVRFRVAFSEAVTGVETGDFSLTVSGVSGAAVTEVSGAGEVYTVTVSTGSGTGTLRLDIPAGASITDLVGNSLSGLPYTRGEAYMVRPNFIFLPLVLRNTP